MNHESKRSGGARGLGGWDNVRFLPNGDIVPPIGDEVLGNVYDVLE